MNGHDLGRGAPGIVLRDIEGVEGEVTFDMEFVPRPEYGRVRPLLAASTAELFVRGGALLLALSFPVALESGDSSVSARVHLHEGERVSAALHHQPRGWTSDDLSPRRDRRPTPRHGRGLATLVGGAPSVRGALADLVYHSGRVLQALMYQPTGAIVAAPTTSLPSTSGASATGTTGSPGFETRASPSTPCGSPHAPTRHTSSSAGWRGGGLGRRFPRRAADHVRGRRGTRPQRARAPASRGMARQPTGSHRQRRLEAATAGCLRGAAGCRPPPPFVPRRPRPVHEGVPSRGRRCSRTIVAIRRQRDLGGAR